MVGSPGPRLWRVLAKDRGPLLEFMKDSLVASKCRILYASPPNEAPFRIAFETTDGERMGIVAYAFLANQEFTKNRPDDEHRFQVKYGSKKHGETYELWQDPYGLYTTLFLGINPDQGFFVAADPVVHSPTKFFISVEFKQHEVDAILKKGWHAWERERVGSQDPVEVLVGGTRDSFLKFVRFEREALGEDQGHRQLLAEDSSLILPRGVRSGRRIVVPTPRLHALAQEFEMDEHEVLKVIAETPYLKMSVRGTVAEVHLVRHLSKVKGVTECQRIVQGSSGDVRLRYRGSRPLTIECKNVLRKLAAGRKVRLDFQRTRASKQDPCSRYYGRTEFDVVAACMHPVTQLWDFQYVIPSSLDPHETCNGKLSNNVRIDERWSGSIADVLAEAAG